MLLVRDEAFTFSSLNKTAASTSSFTCLLLNNLPHQVLLLYFEVFCWLYSKELSIRYRILDENFAHGKALTGRNPHFIIICAVFNINEHNSNIKKMMTMANVVISNSTLHKLYDLAKLILHKLTVGKM
uniref:Uncharacterized protein n=1 Tax=Glossina pallidipes TaxID=7398 RepID=A0A1A9ZWB2_GLOPL